LVHQIPNRALKSENSVSRLCNRLVGIFRTSSCCPDFVYEIVAWAVWANYSLTVGPPAWRTPFEFPRLSEHMAVGR